MKQKHNMAWNKNCGHRLPNGGCRQQYNDMVSMRG